MIVIKSLSDLTIVSLEMLLVKNLSLLVQTRMVVQGQLVEPAICFSDLLTCEELIHSFIRRSQITSCLDSKMFFEPNILIYDIYTRQ